ncbi:2Fe-2S iron-sulfur cluster-binding protein [Sphingomonadaceae bacterium jetA1]|uniref:2Fe-2S iron-sulfur cluster-binding protein n=1 Tax=Facivitalis istanbulensis TaxID=3075838 RepID=UPI00348CB340
MIDEQQDNGVDRKATGETGRLVVRTPSGASRVLNGNAGLSVMEIIREAGMDELPALCGGSCSCATCHVHVASEWLARLPPMAEDEDAVLDEAIGRDQYSRLSCQIPFSTRLDGLEVTIARME